MSDAPRRFRWGLVPIALVAIALVAWLTLGKKKEAKAATPPATPVSVARVETRDLPLSISAIGAAQPWQGVLIRAQVGGRLLRVPAREGSDVRAGELVAEIDPAPYRAALTQAQGVLRRDQALLQAARVDLARYRTLASEDSIPRQQLDTQEALVKQYEGTVMTDQGSVAAAETNLGFTRITAPLSGRVGVRLVDPGNLVTANDATGIVSINQVSPIAVTFSVPEGDFQTLSEASDGFKKPLATAATSQENGADLGAGELSITDNHVDASTGTVALKAKFENAPRKLWPGQLVNVRLTLQTLHAAVVAPAAAVNQGPNGAFAYVVGPDQRVSARPISVATTQGGVAVIRTGLQPGDTVVTDGQLALKPGSKVRVQGAHGAGGGGGQTGGKRHDGGRA